MTFKLNHSTPAASISSNVEATVLTREEAAKILRVSEKTIYNLVKSGELKECKVGRRSVRYRREDLDAYLEKSM